LNECQFCKNRLVYIAMEDTLQKSVFAIKTDTFEGPLELLLNLVEGRKFFINEISLAAVTDEYIAHAKSLNKNDLSELTSFLSITATLILIKSRSLLPGFVVTKEEEKDIQDLESRLVLYALIREIGMQISAKYGVKKIYMLPEREITTAVFAPDPKLTIGAIHLSATDVINRVPKAEVLPQVRIRKIISIEEMITGLTERVARATRVSFKEWQNSVKGSDKDAIKSNIIVSFLAMLELVRQGMMDALQNSDFEDIELLSVKEEHDTMEAGSHEA